MSLFFDAQHPCWGAPASFLQHPFPTSMENQPGGDYGERYGPRRGGPHHRGHRGAPMFGGGWAFPHHAFSHHGIPGFQGAPGLGDQDELFGPSRGGRGGMFGRRGHHHPYHGNPRGRGRGVRALPVPLHGTVSPLEHFLDRFSSEMSNRFEFLSMDRDDHSDSKRIDFQPRADVFDTATEYVIHLSLPGANKSDISVEYDAEKSTVRIEGVVHRPEFSEELHAAMIWNERRREVGVFERSFKLVPSGAGAVDFDGQNITAKMVDGVLIVRVPKVQKEDQGEKQNKKIVVNEDDVLYDADSVDEKEKGVDHEQQDTEATTTNDKHASVVEVEDDMDSMHISSETEAGDLLEEVDEPIYTPSQMSEEDAEEAAEYVKVNTK